MIECPNCAESNADTARFCSACGSALATAQAAEVRKTVTVLFTDVVGSTSVGEHTDPEAMRRVMTRYFDEIKRIVEHHGGLIEKFIGDAVMAVFGVPTVHEDDAMRAVRAAGEIRTRLTELESTLQREHGMTVAWRTGINTGEVVAGDAASGQRFVTGDAVNVAARLEQAAQPGEILIGPETQRLLRGAVTSEAVGPIELRGRSATVTAYRLLELGTSRTPEARRIESPMIGRERPRRLLGQAYEQVISERVCHLLTILGSAGVGKSRLVREFLATGDERVVLRGRCLSYGEGITFWPVAEIVRQAGSLTETDDDQTLRRKLGALIDDERDRAQAVERLGELIGRFQGGAAQAETFWAVRTMVETAARRQPLIVVLDDLHWAEPTLLDLVEHLVDWIRDAPVLLICLARQELLERRPGWGGGKSYATTLTLEPLSDAESRQLAASLLGDVTLNGSLAERISTRAEGNPLFVEEMLGMLIDSGQLVRHNGDWTAVGDVTQISVPPTIQALLAARLDGLPAPERAVLERGSVEGKVFHGSAVAVLAPDVMRDSVPLHLRSLARKELLRPERSDLAGDEAFRFRHLLIRDAAYSALPKETRADLHARFAVWLSGVAAGRTAEYDEILGYHFEQAYRYRRELGPLDDEAHRLAALAARHLGASGERAVDREDIGTARTLLARALELVPADDLYRTRLGAEMGLTLYQSGELRAAETLLADTVKRAEASGDTLGAAHAELVVLSTASALGEINVEEVVARADQLVRLFDEHKDQRAGVRATVVLAQHHFFAGRAQFAEETLARRVAEYPAGQAPYVLLRWAVTMQVLGPAPVEEATRTINAIIASSNSRALEATAVAALGVLRAAVGHFDEGREMTERGIALLRDLGLRSNVWSLTGNFLGDIEVAAGNYEVAEAAMVDAYDNLSAAGDRGFSTTIAGQIAHLYVAQGRLTDAEHYANIAREMASPDDVDAQARALSALARVLAARGEHEAAERAAREAVAMAEQTDYLEFRGARLSNLAEVLLAAGQSEEASDALRRAAQNFEAKGATVQASRVRKRLAEVSIGAE